MLLPGGQQLAGGTSLVQAEGGQVRIWRKLNVSRITKKVTS